MTEFNLDEIWKDIPGYEGLYQASNLGRVKSLDREKEHARSGKRLRKGKILSLFVVNRYLKVSLSVQGKDKPFQVSRLVALSFLGNPRNLPQVNHIDGNKKNNRVENLEFCTASANTLHAYKTGLSPKGSMHGRAKLSERDIPKIRESLLVGMSLSQIARNYRVSAAAIHSIANRRSWNHV